ncbi:MAG TPA: TatD family hydrolase [Patescibacteria group bacterium]
MCPVSKPFLVDTHAHLFFEDYTKDYRQVIQRALDKGIWLIIPGLDLKTSQRAIEIASEFPEGVFAAVGLHPTDILKELNGRQRPDLEPYRELAGQPKVVALGEIGLDYYHLKRIAHEHQISPDDYIQLQRNVLKDFIKLSEEFRLPLIIHCRGVGTEEKVHSDLTNILREFDQSSKGFDTRGVLHCYSGDWEQAVQYLNLDFYISFTGMITYPNFKKQELINKIPLEKLLSETDCPFMAPESKRGQRNEPLFVEETVRKLAEIRGDDFETVAKQLTDNAFEMFQFEKHG